MALLKGLNDKRKSELIMNNINNLNIFAQNV